MKKIFKIKHLLITIIGLFLICISSCGNKYTIMPNGVDICVSSNLAEYMIYKDKLPKMHFDYDNVNVMMEVNGAACYFVQNNQYILSEKFAEHLKRYSEDQVFVVDKTSQLQDNGKANFGKDKLTLDEVDENGNEQKYAIEYQIVAVEEDGTRYSYQFRTFVSGGKRYYIFRYTSNIGIAMEQSLMVVKDANGNNRLLLVPLPFDTKYEVSGNALSLKSLINKDTYLEERYRKYVYPEYLDGLTEEEKIIKIKEWYIKYCNGYTNSDQEFIIEYLGATFIVEFGFKDCGNTLNKPGFRLTYRP